MAVHRRLCKALSLLPIVILGLQFSIASADSSSAEPHNDPGTAWCDERIRELEAQFNSRLTSEVQSTQVRADESCNHRLTEVGNSSQQETANLQARLAEMQALLDTTNDRTNAMEGTIQELQTRVATEAERSSSCGLALQENAQTRQTQAARIQELETAKENELDSCMNQSLTMQQQMDAVKEEHLKQIEAAVQKARLEMQEEHGRKLKMVQDRRDALMDENTEMKASLALSKSQLQETKDELFKIRQELFHTNEKLREASRRWYQILLPAPTVAWLEQTLDNVSQKVQSMWKMTISSPVLSQVKARVMPYLEKAGIPAAWAKIQIHARPLAGMAWSVITTICHEILILLQTLRQELPVYCKEFIKIASLYWKEFVKIIGPKMEQAWEVIKETSGRVWDHVREASQPLVDKIPWEKLEPYIELVQRLWNDFMRDTEWIRVEVSVFCSQAWAVMVQAGETMHRLAIDVFHQVVRTSHLLLKMYEAPAHVVDWTENLHTQSETVIWYIEAALATFVAMFVASKVLGFGGRGRRPGAKLLFKTDPAYSNGAANGSLKKQRIAKRQTEKVAKKKQVQFSGR